MEEKLDITLDDLSDNQRRIAEIVGLDAFVALTREFGGISNIYIMKYSELKKISDDKQLLEDFDGYNYEELARKYDLCAATIRNKIPGELKKQRRRKPIDGQIKMDA